MRIPKQTKTNNMRHQYIDMNKKDGKKLKHRRKSVKDDTLPRVKYISYDHTPFTTDNVIHVGIYNKWVYYFGYSYKPIVDVVKEARESGMDDNSKKKILEIKEELKTKIDTYDSNDKQINKLREDLINSKNSKDKEDKVRELTKINISINKNIKSLKNKLNKLEKVNDDLIIKKIFSNAPMGHSVTAKGIVRTPKVPNDKLMYIEEVFIAYDIIEGGIKDEEHFISLINKYDYGNTFFHLHGRYANKAQMIIKSDAKHPLNGKVLHIPNDEPHKHIVPALFGKIPKRLSKYQGNSYYKYIYDTNFFNPEIPYMFKIKHSHVILKPDISIDENGYYQLLLLDYNEKDFEESSKELDTIYNQVVESDEVNHYRPNHEYVGAMNSNLSLCRFGMKNPPRWLARLMEAVGRYDSRDFLMCRTEEFNDQWFLLLMEHFDDHDYDLSKEVSPFIGSPGVFLLTGDVTFRVFKPRWLTLMINDYLLGHDNGDVYSTDLQFLEEGLLPNSKQRSVKGFIDERVIAFPVSTPLGKILIEEGINFPPHNIWHNIKDKLIEATVNVGKLTHIKHIFTSTTLTTKEYSFRYHAIYENITSAFSNLSNYSDAMVRGATALVQPESYKDKLRASGQEERINCYVEIARLTKDDIDIDSFPNITNQEYYFGRTDAKDYNLVTLDHKVLKDNNIIDAEFGVAVDSSRNKVSSLDTVMDKYVIGEGEVDRLLLSKRGNNIFYPEMRDYTKTSGDPMANAEGNILELEENHKDGKPLSNKS